jgi:hypothetical protein
VLCEGKDDAFAVRTYLDKKRTDLDGRSISVLAVGGVETLPPYARMAAQLGIPWCALSDEDKDAAGSIKPKTAKSRKELTELAGRTDLVPVWPGSLEECLGISGPEKAKPEWQQRQLSSKALADIKAEFPKFAATCEAIAKWLA